MHPMHNALLASGSWKRVFPKQNWQVSFDFYICFVLASKTTQKSKIKSIFLNLETALSYHHLTHRPHLGLKCIVCIVCIMHIMRSGADFRVDTCMHGVPIFELQCRIPKKICMHVFFLVVKNVRIPALHLFGLVLGCRLTIRAAVTKRQSMQHSSCFCLFNKLPRR